MTERKRPQTIDAGPELQASGLIHTLLMPNTPGPYPTVVMLHGRMGNEQAMWIFRRTLPQQWLMVAPRGILHDPGGGFSWLIQAPDEWPPVVAFDPASETLIRFVKALPGLYNADPERTYLMGFSQGAAAAFCVNLSQPGLVQAIASLVGFSPAADVVVATDAFQDLPVHMSVGTQDHRIPLDVAHHTRDFLLAAGAEVEYHEYPTTHKITTAGQRNLRDWWLRR